MTALMRDFPLTAARGLAMTEKTFRVDLRPDLFFIPMLDVTPGAVALKPGEETRVETTADVPPNANLRTIMATLTVSAATGGQAETTSVTVTSGSDPAAKGQDFGVTTKPSRVPRNVQLRLDQGDVIWTHGGTLPAGTTDPIEFAAQANAYLDKAKLDGPPTTFRFLVKSDAPGNVSIAIASVDYSLLQTATWPNSLDGSVRIDRNLDLDFGVVESVPLTDDPPSGFARQQVTLDVTGTMGPERMLGDPAAHDGKQFATVSGDYFVAQAVRIASGGLGFKPGSTVHVAGISGVIEVDEEAELYVEVQADDAGTPAAAAPLAKLNAKLSPPQPGAPRRWAYVAFEAPAELLVDRDFWVVFKGIRGSARLGLAPAGEEYLGAVVVNRGGQLWKPLERPPAVDADAAARFAALARLVYVPEPDTQSGAVKLELAGVAQLANPAGTAQRVTIPASGTAPAVLVVSSHARGALTIANVVQEFARPGQGAVRR